MNNKQDMWRELIAGYFIERGYKISHLRNGWFTLKSCDCVFLNTEIYAYIHNDRGQTLDALSLPDLMNPNVDPLITLRKIDEWLT